MDGREVAARHRDQVRGHRLVVAGDQHHAVVRVAEGVDLDHRRLDVARDERVAHPGVRLGDAVADVGGVEDARLAARLEDAVGDLLDQRPEVEGAGVAHAVGALDEDLRLAEVLLRPVHAQAQRVPLVIDLAQSLALQFTHRRSPSALAIGRRTYPRGMSHDCRRSDHATWIR